MENTQVKECLSSSLFIDKIWQTLKNADPLEGFTNEEEFDMVNLISQIPELLALTNPPKKCARWLAQNVGHSLRITKEDNIEQKNFEEESRGSSETQLQSQNFQQALPMSQQSQRGLPYDPARPEPSEI